jgi:hypothetical protein
MSDFAPLKELGVMVAKAIVAEGGNVTIGQFAEPWAKNADTENITVLFKAVGRDNVEAVLEQLPHEQQR